MNDFKYKINPKCINKWKEAWHFLNQNNLIDFLNAIVELKCDVMADLAMQRASINPDNLTGYYINIRKQAQMENKQLNYHSWQVYKNLSIDVNEVTEDYMFSNYQRVYTKEEATTLVRYYMLSHAICFFLPKDNFERENIDYRRDKKTVESYIKNSMIPVAYALPDDMILTTVNTMLLQIKLRLKDKPNSALANEKINCVQKLLDKFNNDKSVTTHKLLKEIHGAESGPLAKHEWWIFEFLALFFPQLRTKSARQLHEIKLKVENYQEDAIRNQLGLN